VVLELLKYEEAQEGMKCEECGGWMDKAPELDLPSDGVFKPITLDHMPHDGEGSITFDSKEELRRHCRKHKVESGALL
jgi:hypothetical protein